MKYVLFTRDKPPVFYKHILEMFTTSYEIRPVCKESLLGLHHHGSLRLIFDEKYVTDEILDLANACCTGMDQEVVVL